MIEYENGDGPGPSLAVIEFVDGPRAGERQPQKDRPATIDGPGGVYRRSLACADDGVVRYIWTATAPAQTGESEHEQASAAV